VSEPMTGAEAGRRSADGLRLNPWNLLLLVPFLMLVTPWINADAPRVFGMPCFYWIQFAFVPVGVVCVAVVYVRTRDEAAPSAAGTPPDVDELDEGTAGATGGSVAR
jgi:hypothetical protein